MVSAQNNADFAAGQMQGLKSSFGRGEEKQHRKKTSFVSNHSGGGGLGNELENLNYQPLGDDYEERNDDMDYHEIQIEDMGSLRGSPLGSPRGSPGASPQGSFVGHYDNFTPPPKVQT